MKRNAVKKKDGTKGDIAATYNAFKLYQGRQYTGMAVGRRHKWHYDAGTWIDKKITPDKWLINFEVTKRRAGKAPEGSGVPVGTEYHWYILAHQMVKKLDANSYSTVMNGIKLKLAHKRSSTNKWNISDATQRNHLVKMLKAYIQELEEMEIDHFVAEEKNIIDAQKSSARKIPVKKTKKKVKREMVAEEAM
jgi:hypothetical protein